MDFTALRTQGISLLEQMNGGVWTDFNVHDPGITILEVLCYVLTDLAYRTGYSVPDLLASAGGSAAKSLYTAPEILTTNPVTVTDLRKVALDVDGVKNAWIEPAQSSADFYYHPGKQEISLAPDPPTTVPPAKVPVTMKGLYQVLIETSDLAGIDGSEVRRSVALQLHKHRALCEDFVDVQVLEPQLVQVQMAIEIGPIEDAVDLLAQVLEAIEEQLSPMIPFARADELLNSGQAVQDVLEGPRLQRGIVTDDALRSGDRRTSLNSSDVIHAVMDVQGVRAVRSLSLSSGGKTEEWSLALDPKKVPRLDVAGSKIQLEREGIAAATDFTAAGSTYQERLSRKYKIDVSSDEEIFAVPEGKDRELAQYYSLQHHLPPAYAVGDAGLPDSASDDRKARAKQLKGYLMLFDQLLANEFAQLAHAGELLSFQDDGTRTYYSRIIQDDTLSLDDIRATDLATHQARVDAITEDPQGSLLRKGRFLNHLLARFSEQMTDYSLVLPQALPPRETSAAAKLVRDKQTFLRSYPRISGARGSGMNYLDASGPDNRSGLEQRISLRLGLLREEQPLLVEHVLLRPMEGDDPQVDPLLSASSLKDPFSLQLTFVFPAVSDRMRSAETPFRSLVERTVREETPAHLTPYIQWLDGPAFSKFQAAYATWIEARRVHCSERFDIKI